MEYQELIGSRRSIRYFEPDKPVEQDKIQKILEACLISSCAVNAHWLKAVVVKRADVSAEDLEMMKNPVQALVIALAPVHIYFYCDLGVVNEVKGARLKQLVDAGALNPTHGWSHKFVDELVYPQILKPLTDSPAYPVSAAFDCGVAANQGLLMAFELGLGACLTAFNAEGQPLGDGVSLLAIKLVPRAGEYPNSVRVNFGGKLALLGYDTDMRTVRPGETINLTLYWQALAPMKLDYSVFMHLTSTGGEIPVKNDSLPYTSPKRTRRWTTGQVMKEVRTLAIPDYVLPGLYDIDLGIFSVDTGDRLPVVAPDGHYISEQMTLVQVRIEK